MVEIVETKDGGVAENSAGRLFCAVHQLTHERVQTSCRHVLVLYHSAASSRYACQGTSGNLFGHMHLSACRKECHGGSQLE